MIMTGRTQERSPLLLEAAFLFLELGLFFREALLLFLERRLLLLRALSDRSVENGRSP